MFKTALSSLLCLVAASTVAATENTEQTLDEIQQKMKASFTHLKATHFGSTGIPGLYEVMAGGRMMYFMPSSETLFVGELYDKAGRSLTAQRKRELQTEKLKTLDMADALVIGTGPKTIIEFTDPDCPYCQKLHAQLTQKPDVSRAVFFSILDGLHPKATAKAVHVVCSADAQKALDDIFARRIGDDQLIDCEHGRQVVARHKQISENFGVSGTPTVVLGDSVVTGYREAQIAQYLEIQ